MRGEARGAGGTERAPRAGALRPRVRVSFTLEEELGHLGRGGIVGQWGRGVLVERAGVLESGGEGRHLETAGAADRSGLRGLWER